MSADTRHARSRTAFASALAKLSLARGLYDGPFTAEKQALLMRRLGDALDDLALAHMCAGDAATDAPFIPRLQEPAAPAPDAEAVPAAPAATPAPEPCAPMPDAYGYQRNVVPLRRHG